MSQSLPSFWQDKNWKFFRESCGEKTLEWEEAECKALIIEKSPHFLKFWKKKVWELQRGPYGNIEQTSVLLQKVFSDAKQNNIERVRVFPPLGIADFWEKYFPISKANSYGVRTESSPEIFPEHTLFLDLKKTEDELFSEMKQGGRRNIRKAKKAKIEIFEEDNIENFWEILQETASRDGFTTNKKFIYEKMLSSYSLENSDKNNKKVVVLSARDETGEVLASKIFCISGGIGIYYYGASSNRKRNLMAPYLLQWKGIQWAKKNGAKKYDLLGLSPEDSPGHQLATVSQFKLKFGGERVISGKGIDFVL